VKVAANVRWKPSKIKVRDTGGWTECGGQLLVLNLNPVVAGEDQDYD
jgi:hypothetical protein